MRTFLLASGALMLMLASSYGGDIYQTVNQGSGSPAWSTSAIWGTPAAVATAGNNYYTVAGLGSSFVSGFGVDASTRVRDTGSVFGGDSLTVVTGTEVLQKAGNNTTSTSTANMILDGGIFAYGSAGPSTVNLAGSLAVPTTGILGMGGANILNVTSLLTGSGTLSLRSADTAPTIEFSGDLSGFNGTFQIGGGDGGIVNVDFLQDYTLSASITMDTVGNHLDVLNLSHALTVNSFQFGAAGIAPGTYTAAELNGLVGNGSQFTGAGTLTTIAPVPEPSVVALGSLGTLFMFIRRRAK